MSHRFFDGNPICKGHTVHFQALSRHLPTLKLTDDAMTPRGPHIFEGPLPDPIRQHLLNQTAPQMMELDRDWIICSAPEEEGVTLTILNREQAVTHLRFWMHLLTLEIRHDHHATELWRYQQQDQSSQSTTTLEREALLGTRLIDELTRLFDVKMEQGFDMSTIQWNVDPDLRLHQPADAVSQALSACFHHINRFAAHASLKLTAQQGPEKNLMRFSWEQSHCPWGIGESCSRSLLLKKLDQLGQPHLSLTAHGRCSIQLSWDDSAKPTPKTYLYIDTTKQPNLGLLALAAMHLNDHILISDPVELQRCLAFDPEGLFILDGRTLDTCSPTERETLTKMARPRMFCLTDGSGWVPDVVTPIACDFGAIYPSIEQLANLASVKA